MNMPFDETEICDIITDRELEEIGIAYGSKEKYQAAVREAAGKLLLGRSSSVCEPAYPLYGNPFPLGNPGTSIVAESELQNIKRINIVGKKITSVKEAAALFSAFRDPRMEIII